MRIVSFDRTLLYNHYEQLKIRVNELQESVKLLQLQQNEEKEENMLQLPTAFKPVNKQTVNKQIVNKQTVSNISFL